MAPRVIPWAAVVLATVATICALVINKPEQLGSHAVAGGQTIMLEVADTEEARIKGLSGRESLAKNRGLLFVFERDAQHCFWMRDMRFAIDMIWLNQRGVVVDVEERVTPETYPGTFCSERDARYVLEVNAGVARQFEITEGTRVELRLEP